MYNRKLQIIFTCSAVENCLTNSTNQLAIKQRCEPLVTDCASDCLPEAPIFENCLSNCNCANSTDSYPWDCIDQCKYQVKNSKYAEIVDCLYFPCRQIKNSLDSSDTSYFAVNILIIILAPVLLLLIIFYLRRRSKKYLLQINSTEGKNNFVTLFFFVNSPVYSPCRC